MARYEWQDLPKPINAFTTRNTKMKNLNTGEVIQYYSANTKIVVAQKAVTPSGTFYRTRSAEHHCLNWAFEAAALGLPNEVAPLALDCSTQTAGSRSEKTKISRREATSKSGEKHPFHALLRRFFSRS